MTGYRGAWKPQAALEAGKNPSTYADLYSTVSIIRTLNDLLSPVASQLGCGLTYLAEESSDSEKIKRLRELLPSSVHHGLHCPEDFFQNLGLRVILDAIDGTGNFTRGLPLFCSALAILVDAEVRVSAVYDPIHHVVYSATLRGPSECPEETAEAWMWQVATGVRTRFPELSEASVLDHEAIGVHFSRTRKDKLCEFLRPNGDTPGMLERLALASSGVYALNSGILAMTEVARGSLGAFVNTITNPWDVAAGEVLVRAVGGRVTDFAGSSISYYPKCGPTSVLAAGRGLYDHVLRLVTSGA